MSTPEVFFRETIDLGRYSNSVSRKFVSTYNDIIVASAKKLRQIDLRQQVAAEGVIVAPQTRKRLRAIIAQSKTSLNTWAKTTTKEMTQELQGLALLQTDFIKNELQKVTASGNIPINSVAVSPKYAESFVTTDPTQVNIFTSKQFTEDDFVKFGSGKFELTSRQGAAITLPNGQTVEKAFRGIAERQQEQLARHIRQGVFSGESTQQIARRMIGRLDFGQKGNVRQIAAAGGEITKLANYQVRTIVRTSINQVQNQASQAVYAANKKVSPRYEYVATLDSRTSAICMRLDGQEFEYNKGPTPPQHFNCRSTTVPVVDFDGLQKKYPNLEKPPATQFDTRPSATGRVPQGTTYGNWLLNQDKKLQVKTLGNEGKVNYFKKLAKREGSGQAALKKMIRNDGSEVSLARLKQLYGKPSAIKPKAKPTPKPKAVVGTAKASDFVKSKPLKKLTEKELLADLKKYREHEIKIQTARGVKNPYTGPIDFKIQSLEQGLSIEKVVDKGSPMYNDYLFWKQGFNKRPTRVKNVQALKDRKDLVKGADGENLVLYRGVSDDRWNDQFKGIGKGGDNYYAGEGLYGNGTYAAARNFHGTKASLSKSTKNAIEIAEHYTQSNAFAPKLSVAEKQKRITAFGLKKDANFKTWKKGSSTKNLKNEHAYPDSDWYKQTFGKWEDETIAKAEKLTGYKIESVGEACTILGIDGYQVPLPLVDKLVEGGAELIHFDADYWVILNRSAIVVSDTVKL